MSGSGPRIGRRKHARGTLAVWLRRNVRTPLEATVPVEAIRRGHRLRRALFPGRYTDADPVGVLEVDPHRIEWSVLETAPKRPQWGRVEGGDWDRRRRPFDDRAVPRGVRQRFVDGRPWRETALFDAYCDQLERFGNAWGYTSVDAFDRRCQEIERLYRAIRDQGYRRQTALCRWRGVEPIATRVDEINVDVGRDGTLCWRGYGQHRLAIAKLLELESVPVLIHRRHAGWQARRDRLRSRPSHASGVGDDRPPAHPDLATLVEDSRRDPP